MMTKLASQKLWAFSDWVGLANGNAFHEDQLPPGTAGIFQNTLRLQQKGCSIADVFNLILLPGNYCIFIKIPLKVVPKGPIDESALVKVSDSSKQLCEAILTQFYVTIWYSKATLR